MVKLQETKNRFYITVPNQYVKLLGWKKGQDLTVYPLAEKQLVIKEMPKQA